MSGRIGPVVLASMVHTVSIRVAMSTGSNVQDALTATRDSLQRTDQIPDDMDGVLADMEALWSRAHELVLRRGQDTAAKAQARREEGL